MTPRPATRAPRPSTSSPVRPGDDAVAEPAITTFFIPELNGANEEEVYAAIRSAAALRTGHAPQAERIFKLWYRRDGVDCEAEVGKPDPICGHQVLAILDLGRHDPYLVDCASTAGARVQIIVDKPVYAATQFTASTRV
jgi:hypothetical protein